MTDTQRQEILARGRAGERPYSIGRTLGVHGELVCRVLDAHGVSRPRYRAHTAAFVSRVVDDVRRGRSYQQAARTHGLALSLVIRWCADRGVRSVHASPSTEAA